MKDKIIITIAYLFSKRTYIYCFIIVLGLYLIISTTTNYLVKEILEIKKMDDIRKIQLEQLEKELNWYNEQLKPLKLKFSELKDKIMPLKGKKLCIEQKIWTLESCPEQWFIPKANADYFKPDIAVINPKPVWLKNSQWQSKSKAELMWNTFDEISKNHKIPVDYWYASEKKWKIKKEVALCIAWADSWLGRYLKTPNNIWNVGNNDRGNRVSVSTLEKWVDLIFQTLNNKYLKHKQSIWSLSVWWGGTKPFYATSKENWNINTLNCLSTIHWVQINENFMIRL